MKSFFKIFLSLFTFVLAFTISFATSPVDKLQADANALKSTLDIYISQGQKLDNDLQIVLKTLDMLDKIANDLKRLDNSLTTVDNLLTVAKDIPQTAEQANALSADIGRIHPPVTKASDKVNTFNTKISPSRENIRKFDNSLNKVITKTEAFEIKLSKYVNDLEKAQKCISSLPAGSLKDDLQSKLDKLANESDVRVVQANTILLDIISKIKIADDYIQNKLTKCIEPFENLEKEVEKVISNLNSLINPLNDLGALINKSYCVDFPYPSPTWRKPWRIKHYDLCMSFKTIIRGSDYIEKEIKHILSSALYDAAKVFGIGKLINELESQAKNELNTITRRLNLKIDIGIPGLDKLEQELSDFENGLNELMPKLNIDESPFENLMNNFENDFDTLENIYKNCK